MVGWIVAVTAWQVAVEMFSDYADIAPEMFVRISDLPISDSIRDLRCVVQPNY